MSTLAPHNNPQLLGHDGALEQILGAFKSGRMPQSWLIGGVDGIGKATLAYHVANYVLSNGENPAGRLNAEHPAFKLIAAEAHPDLFVVGRAIDEKSGEPKDAIAVETARNIAPFLHLTPALGGWRVAIIDEAHLLNRHGQNAILKVIEEPPPRCLILMTVTTPSALLPTIRSRCRMVQLDPLTDGTIRSVLARLGVEVEGEELARLVRLSAGSVGLALKIVESGVMPLYDEMMELLQAMPKLDVVRLHTLADQISRKADAQGFRVLSQLLINYLRLEARDLAVGVRERAQLDKSLLLWEKVTHTLKGVDQSSLDRKLAFINALTLISRS